MSKCEFCNDTGSLSKDLYGDLNCAKCEIATERAEFEQWTIENTFKVNDLGMAWKIYKHGKAAALEQAIRIALEAAAKQCDFRARNWSSYENEPDYLARGEAASICADAIRALKP